MEEKLTQFSTNMDALTEQEQKQLIALINKGNKPLKRRWRAEIDEMYFLISGDGEIVFYIEKGTTFNKKAYELGNYFATKEEAEFELNKKLVLQQLKDYALSHNETELDWGNRQQAKYFIVQTADGLTWGRVYSKEYSGQVYFSSAEIVYSAIKAIGADKIIKYLFKGE